MNQFLPKLNVCALVAYILSVYAVPFAIFSVMQSLLAGGRSAGDFSAFLQLFGVPLALMGLVCLIVLLNGVLAVIGLITRTTVSFRKTLIFKIAAVPFFAVNFGFWLIGSLVFHTSFVALPMLPIVIPYTYIVMLGTSSHTITNLLRLRLDKRITTGQCVKHILLQLLFAIDVLDGIVLAVKQKRYAYHADS
jgi:hypothetical protein